MSTETIPAIPIPEAINHFSETTLGQLGYHMILAGVAKMQIGLSAEEKHMLRLFICTNRLDDTKTGDAIKNLLEAIIEES